MSTKVERMPNEPIVIVTMIPPINPVQDAPTSTMEAIKLKKETGGHV